jgi:hypothetical protein
MDSLGQSAEAVSREAAGTAICNNSRFGRNPQDWESFLDTNECPSMISIYLGGMQGRTNTYSNNIIALHITKKRNLDR